MRTDQEDGVLSNELFIVVIYFARQQAPLEQRLMLLGDIRSCELIVVSALLIMFFSPDISVENLLLKMSDLFIIKLYFLSLINKHNET